MKPTAENLSMQGDKYLGITYRANNFDCQDFVEHCLKDVGISLNLPGSNAWYRKMTWVGTPEECIKKFGNIPKGAFLYILKKDGKEPDKYKKDNIGNASHIGIYTARTGEEMVKRGLEEGNSKAKGCNFGDYAINSSSTHGKVCTSKFYGKAINGGWNRIGLWNQLSYGDKIDSILNGGSKPSGGGEVIVYKKVYAENGGSVNLRAKESTTSQLLERVPSGSTVLVNSEGSEWSNITYGNKTGYMMTKFLVSDIPSDDKKGSITITLPKSTAETVLPVLKDMINQIEKQI